MKNRIRKWILRFLFNTENPSLGLTIMHNTLEENAEVTGNTVQLNVAVLYLNGREYENVKLQFDFPDDEQIKKGTES